ncbi:MAG: class I SAM-dependent methyltransferase [Bryobacterales bacterium]|jgi:O-antigen chain-terminating methyltransferase|nr:class I SAM-dependent methyltransferase [Bryobacterales bacterium]
MYLEYSGIFGRIRRRYFTKVIQQLQQHGCRRLLDYGCGPGDVIQLCQDLGLPAVGIDNSTRSVELAKRRGLQVLLGDASAPALREEKFDAIFLQSVIEHIPDATAELSKLVAMLPPGGLLVLSAPTPCADFWNDPTHVRPFTPRSFRILGELLGMEAIEINYVFSYLLGVRLESALWYKMINLVPAPLGSNLVGVYRKPADERS